jgi:hypothetical protein
MSAAPPAHVLGPFLAAADAAARERDDVDAEVARELMTEAATMLHDSLALDDLDPHDLEVVVAGLGSDLVSVDPGAAVRERAAAVADDDPALHDPGGVRGAYLVTLAVLQL